MNIVRINNNGSMNDLKLNKPSTQNIILKLNKLSNINDEKIKELYYWKHNSNIIKCYGYYEGDAGFENKHELLPNGNSTFLENHLKSYYLVKFSLYVLIKK